MGVFANYLYAVQVEATSCRAHTWQKVENANPVRFTTLPLPVGVYKYTCHLRTQLWEHLEAPPLFHPSVELCLKCIVPG